MADWFFEHGETAGVPCEIAWASWTDVANWSFDPSIEWVRLDGPFAAGTRGTTKPRNGDSLSWLIREASPGRATIELELPGALVRFDWRFAEAGPAATRITQSVTLEGVKASDYVGLAESQLAAGIPLGMRRLVAEMEKALGPRRRQGET
jgi:hypothetical protein